MCKTPLAALALALLAAAGIPYTSLGHAAEGVRALTEIGKATYYARHFEGRLTASGDVFRHAELTAAHPSYPFGTIVRVTTVNRGRSVVVRITDRGPSPRQQRRGTVIDVSKRAAAELGMMRAGRVAVKLEVLQWGSESRPRLRWEPRKEIEAPAGESAAAASPQG
jgi:rare lipoprotein A